MCGTARDIGGGESQCTDGLAAYGGAASTFSSAAAIFVAAWLLRQLIINRLARSVAHEFDARLEALRAELNRQGARESAVLATALGVVTAAQTSAQDARLTALRNLWDAVLEIRTSVTFSGSLDILTAEELQRAPAEHKKLLDRTIDLNRAYLDDPLTLFEQFQGIERVRPLVSDVAWAYFFAYRAFEFRILHLISHYRETGQFISPFADTRESRVFSWFQLMKRGGGAAFSRDPVARG